jgi:hypothetical protein
MSERIQVNVGGTHFETTRETLEQIPYFEAILARWRDEKAIFVDRSATGFDHVVNLIRNPTYAFPRQYKEELDFYCLEYEFPADPLTEIRKELKEIRETQNVIRTEIQYLEEAQSEINNSMGYPAYTEECTDCNGRKILENVMNVHLAVDVNV